MIEVIWKLVPVLMPFFVGLTLRRLHVCSPKVADKLLKFTFYFTVPALVIASFYPIDMTPELFLMPLVAVLVFVSCLLVSLTVSSKLQLERRTRGTFLLGSAFMNSSLVFPFVIALGGNDAFITIFLFDSGNAIMILTLGYFIACRHGEGQTTAVAALRRVISAPPLWSLLTAITIAETRFRLPENLLGVLGVIGELTMPLIMLSLGIYLRPSLHHHRLVSRMMSIRMAGGFIVGLILAKVLKLDPAVTTVVVTGASAPCGYNTLIFSSLTRLDGALAASAVSISLLVGLVTIPLMLLYL